MRPEEDTDRRKAEALATHLDHSVVAALGATLAGDEAAAIGAWDRALTLSHALTKVPNGIVEKRLTLTAARLAAWDDSEEDVPGQARMLRRHRSGSRRRGSPLATITSSCGKACASALIDTRPLTDEHRRLLVRALSAMVAPARAPAADAGELAALVGTTKLDWEAAELIERAGLLPI